MNVIQGSGDIAEEPQWSLIYTNPEDQEAAARHWASVTRELRDAGTLAEANGHAILRLVNFRVSYDRLSRYVAEHGEVAPPKRGSKTAIARPRPEWIAMQDAATIIERAEGELGLSPRRRGAVTKVDRKARSKQAADAYLKLAK